MKFALFAAALALVPVGAWAEPSPAIRAALADPARPTADTARDAARKPAEILALAEVEPGDKVADFIMGGGYFTRLLARTVGDKGKVYAYQPAEFIQFQASYGEQQKAVAGAYANVAPLSMPVAAVAFPEPLDAIITVQNYHDMHLNIAPADLAGKVDKVLFDALKPGGVLLVVDHAAAAGAPFSVADTLHRIDPAAARKEIEAAGFEFVEESKLLANPADPRTASVFDPAIRGKTDQFIYKFRKPRS